MEPGLLSDEPTRGGELPLAWIRGWPPSRGLLAGLRAQKSDRLNVLAMRCQACGFLELFATTPD